MRPPTATVLQRIQARDPQRKHLKRAVRRFDRHITRQRLQRFRRA